ncbi:MAG: MMPL family transporter, partial [Flavobacteriales bacterium]
MDKETSEELRKELLRLREKYTFDDIHYAGRSIGMTYYIQKMRYEFIFFLVVAAIVVVIFLAITFRSIWGIWVPLTVVILSIVWTLGIM